MELQKFSLECKKDVQLCAQCQNQEQSKKDEESKVKPRLRAEASEHMETPSLSRRNDLWILSIIS